MYTRDKLGPIEMTGIWNREVSEFGGCLSIRLNGISNGTVEMCTF